MTPEHWQQVDQIFQAAIELRPEERFSFLDKACAGDANLRNEVEALLASDEHGLTFIENPAFEMAANLLVSNKPELPEGYRLGDYRIISLLGKGGMGEVYLAEDIELGRKIAIKLLPDEFTRDAQRLQRFRQEARAASALNHPNIITIHQIGQVEGRYFIATELIDGETLRQLMRQSRLTLGKVVDIATQVSSALAAAHQAGIVHRDIKPENIMLRRDGYVKVLDFGLAKLTEQYEPAIPAQAAENVNVSSGMVMGTVKYMSPEQARGQQVDPRSDIFSLGVVLYEMLSGHTPFEGESSSEYIAALLRKEPPALADTPPEMQLIVGRALRKKREERYPTIQELLIDLSALTENKSGALTGRISAAADTSELSTITITPVSTVSNISSIVSGIKRHKTSAALVLTSLLVLAVGLAFVLRRVIKLRAPSTQMKISRIPNLEKAETVAISPDGRHVAQVANNSGQYGIWLIELATGNTTPIVITSGDDFLSDVTFSTDGERIFYVTERSLFQVPARGGSPVKLMADVNSPISITPDEKEVAFVKRNSDQAIALTVVNVDGSGEQVVTTRKEPEFIGLPAWSPDRKVIVCTVGWNASNKTETLVEVDALTGRERPLTNQRWQGFDSLIWLPDGSGLIAVAAERFGGPRQILHISYPGGEVRKITNDLDDYGGISLTADGNNLVTPQIATRSSLWVAPKDNLNAAKPVTSSERPLYRAVSFTPDGRILYQSTVSGNPDIWIMNADGTNQKQLTADAGNNILMKASPDGRYIVFASNRANKGAFNIWRMNIDGSNPLQLTHGSGETGPAVTPDGQWVVYSKGGPEVINAEKTLWKVPIDGGEPLQITNSPALGAAISADGTLIACWFKQEAKSPWGLALIPVNGGPPIQVFKVPPGPTLWPRWTPDGQAISYIRSNQGVSNIWSQPINGGPPKQLTQFTSESIDGHDWSRDGQLVCSRQHIAQDVVLISDFK